MARLVVSSFDWTQVSQSAYAAVVKGEWRQAIKILKRNLAHIKKLKSESNRAWTFYTIGCGYIHCSRFAEALPFLKQAARIYRKCDAKSANNAYLWLGWTLRKRKRYAQAADAYTAASDFEKSHSTPKFDFVVECLVKAAECRWTARQFGKAIPLFREAFRIGTRYDAAPSQLTKLFGELTTASKTPNAATDVRKIVTLARIVRRHTNEKIAQLAPAKTKSGKESDSYFGVVIKDPYRWLEKMNSEAVKEWISLQNKRSSHYLNSLLERQTLLQSTYSFYYEEPCLPHVTGKSLYFYHRRAHSRGRLLKSSGLKAPQKLILNVDEFAQGDLLSGWWPSPNGRHLVFGVAACGSDWLNLRLRNMGTNAEESQPMPILRHASIIWSADSKGFFYSGFVKEKQRYQIRYHSLNTRSRQDRLIYEHKPVSEEINLTNIVHKQYLLMNLSKGHYGSIASLSLKNRNAPLRTLLKTKYSHFMNAGEGNGKVYFLTNHLSQKNRIISATLSPGRWSAPVIKEEVPDSDSVLVQMLKCRRILVCIYQSDQGMSVRRVKNGCLLAETVKTPPHTFIDEARLVDYPNVWFTTEGHTSPPRIYKYNVESGALRKLPVKKHGTTDDVFETTLISATSNDGTRVPIYVSYKKGLKLNGNNPTLLTAYGGFNHFARLSYSSLYMSWLSCGGVLAHAVIRGGGEFGKEWREGGMGEHKQNCFDDFIAAAEQLVSAKFTRPEKLGMYGGSNGGLLVGSVLTQRPDLFGAAVISSALLDMLRYHLFDTAKVWINEYGVARRKKDFQILRAYSPLHNLRAAKYPATLVFTGGDDDRVSPAHSYKFVAQLQRAQRGNAPILLKVEEQSGHSLRHDTSYWMDMLSFFAHHLGLRTDAF